MRKQLGKQHQPIQLNFLASLGILPLRLMAGLAMILHGLPKFAHLTTWMNGTGLDAAPPFMQAAAAILQVFGGLCWMLGFLTPTSSLAILTVMWVGVIKRLQAGQEFVITSSSGTGSGPSFELAALYICIGLLLMTTGPGRFSLDAKVFGEREHL